jgi:hypothetical protein
MLPYGARLAARSQISHPGTVMATRTIPSGPAPPSGVTAGSSEVSALSQRTAAKSSCLGKSWRQVFQVLLAALTMATVFPSCGGEAFSVNSGSAGQGSAGLSGSGAGASGGAGGGGGLGSEGGAGGATAVPDGRVDCIPGAGGDALCLEFCEASGWQTALCEASRSCQCGTGTSQQCDVADPSSGSDGTTSCPEGMSCRIGGSCVASGPAGLGEACVNITGDCQAGMMCTTGFCRTVCRIAAPPAACTCMQIGTSIWGTCR